MSDDVITRIRAYHIPDGEGGEEVLEPVTPVKPISGKAVFVSAADIEVLRNVGEGLCRLGAVEAGLTLLAITAAWEIL